MKKSISIILSITLCLSVVLFPTVQANAKTKTKTNDYNLKVIKDTSTAKEVQTQDSDYKYTSAFDKENNTMSFETVNLKTGEVKSTLIDLNTSAGKAVPENNTVMTAAPENSIMMAAASQKQNTYTNWEYTKTYGSPNVWELRRPDSTVFSWYYFKTKETTLNSAYLNAFRTHVESVNTYEAAILGSLTVTVFSALAASAAGAGAIFTGGTLSPAAWGALLVAVGASTALVSTCMLYDLACKNAYDQYFETFYHSTVFY